MSEPIINIITGEDAPNINGISDFTNNSGKDITSNKMKTQAATEMQQQAAAHLRAADHLLSAAAHHSSSVGPAPDLPSPLPELWIPMEEDEDFSEEMNLLPKYKLINTVRKDNSCDTCCESLIKYVLVLFNVVFASIGLAIIYLGAYIKIHYRSEYYMDFMGVGEYWQWFNIPIIVGLVIFLVAVCGFIGAFLKHPFLLYIHTVLHFAIIIAEIGTLLIIAIGSLSVFYSKIGLKIEKDVIIKSSMEFYSDFWTIIESAISWTWDFMQRTLECCGWDGPSDWTNTTYGQIPCSCCIEEQVLNCRDDMKVDFFSQGCNEALQEIMLSYDDITFWISIMIQIIIPSFALLQLIMILCSCCNAGTKMYLLDREKMQR